MNNYCFTGRLTRDSEVRQTKAGMSICTFSVAVDYGFGKNKGTNWLRCSLFGKRADSALPSYLLKGTLVAVSGELRIGSYPDSEQNKKTSIDISVDKLDLLGGKNKSETTQRQEKPLMDSPKDSKDKMPIEPTKIIDKSVEQDDDIPF